MYLIYYTAIYKRLYIYKAGRAGQCVGPTVTDTRDGYSHVKLWRHLLSYSLWVLM